MDNNQITKNSLEQSQKKQQNSQKKQYTFYQPNKKSKGVFDLRFNEIKGSLIDENIFSASYKMLRWKLFLKDQGVPKDKKKLEEELPIYKPEFKTFEDKIGYTWIGHSTAVISIGKLVNIIIDPVFSDRASPVQFLGPKRFREPACMIQQLPRIDLVLVSHDHYDHFDSDSLQKIAVLNKQAIFAAGLESRSAFPQVCRSRIQQFNWAQSKRISVGQNADYWLDITFVPACHWSRRGANDQNTRLWGGFVLQTPRGQSIFYSGDTGYCGVFKQIGDHFGCFDLSIIPIGAYQPREYLKNQHINPEEAVIVHQQIKSKKSVGVHWGTFPLGSQHYTAARRDLQLACAKYQLKKDQFVTIPHGGYLSVDFKQ